MKLLLNIFAVTSTIVLHVCCFAASTVTFHRRPGSSPYTSLYRVVSNMPPNCITINTSPLHPCVYRPRSNDTRTTGGTMIIRPTNKIVMTYFLGGPVFLILNYDDKYKERDLCACVRLLIGEYVPWSRPDRSIDQFWCRD